MKQRIIVSITGFVAFLIISFLPNTLLAQGGDPELIIEQHNYGICDNDTAQVIIRVTGIPQITVRFTFEEEEFNVNSSTNDIELLLSEPGNYIITGFRDNFSQMIDTLDTIRVEQYPPPEIYYTGGGHSCDVVQIDPLTVHFVGVPPFTLVYLLNNDPFVLTTNETSYTFSLPYDFILITQELSDLNCTNEIFDTVYAQAGFIPTPAIEGDSLTCAGTDLVYSTDKGFYNARWSVTGEMIYEVDTASGGSFITVSWITPGNYEIHLTLINPGNGCESTESILPVVVYPTPVAPAETDTAVCLSNLEGLYIEIETDEEDIIYWPALDYNGNSITVDEVGDYYYIQSNSFGCSDSSAVHVISNCQSSLFVPDAFTPNGDDVNNYLIVFGLYSNLDFSVYSPSGILLYRAVNEEVNWDGTSSGKEVPNGSYSWHAVFSDGDGNEQRKSGSITIIR
jgi:gliding motility-associated-like protein